MDAKNWIAIGAASALGLGVMAAGAVSTASALPLVAGVTNLEVPGITVTDDSKGSASEIDFSVTTNSVVGPDDSASPTPSSSSNPDDSASPSPSSSSSPDSSPSPVTAPSPVSPASPASVDSPDDSDDDSDDSED
jgi:hypothetical protein